MLETKVSWLHDEKETGKKEKNVSLPKPHAESHVFTTTVLFNFMGVVLAVSVRFAMTLESQPFCGWEKLDKNRPHFQSWGAMNYCIVGQRRRAFPYPYLCSVSWSTWNVAEEIGSTVYSSSEVRRTQRRSLTNKGNDAQWDHDGQRQNRRVNVKRTTQPMACHLPSLQACTNQSKTWRSPPSLATFPGHSPQALENKNVFGGCRAEKGCHKGTRFTCRPASTSLVNQQWVPWGRKVAGMWMRRGRDGGEGVCEKTMATQVSIQSWSRKRQTRERRVDEVFILQIYELMIVEMYTDPALLPSLPRHKPTRLPACQPPRLHQTMVSKRLFFFQWSGQATVGTTAVARWRFLPTQHASHPPQRGGMGGGWRCRLHKNLRQTWWKAALCTQICSASNGSFKGQKKWLHLCYVFIMETAPLSPVRVWDALFEMCTWRLTPSNWLVDQWRWPNVPAAAVLPCGAPGFGAAALLPPA